MQRVVHVVVPLRGQPVARRRPGTRTSRGSFWSDSAIRRQRPAQVRRQRVHLDRQLLQQVQRAQVDQRVHGVQPQPVHVVLVQPHQRVVQDVAPHRAGPRAVQVDQLAPGAAARLVDTARSGAGTPRTGRGGCRRRRAARRCPRWWQASTKCLKPSGPPYGSCTAYQPTPSYPQLWVPLTAFTGSTSTRSTPRSTRWSSRSTAAAKVPCRGEGADVQLVEDRPGQLPPGPAARPSTRTPAGRAAGSGRARRRAASATGGRAAACRRRRGGRRSRCPGRRRARSPASVPSAAGDHLVVGPERAQPHPLVVRRPHLERRHPVSLRPAPVPPRPHPRRALVSRAPAGRRTGPRTAARPPPTGSG